MDSKEKCNNCGCSQFYIQVGLQFCEECGLQQRDIEMELDAFVPDRKKPQRVSSKRDDNLKGIASSHNFLHD